jgi:hypothetical protein
MDFDERDEMEFLGTSGFAFDYFENSESDEDHDYMFLQPRSPDYLNSSMLIPKNQPSSTSYGFARTGFQTTCKITKN